MNTISRTFLGWAAILGALAVGIGAFGAHGLKPLLNDYQIAIFEKGVHYQFFHTLALLATGLLLRDHPNNRYLRLSGWLFIAGIIGFSGSLYLLACSNLLNLPLAIIGPVTPLGGLCFLGGWLLFFWAVKNLPAKA